MTIVRSLIAVLGIATALTTTGPLQVIGWTLAAAMVTSLVQSALYHRRLSQLIQPDWELLSDDTPSTDGLDRLSKSLQVARGKLKRRVEGLALERDRLGVLLEGMAEGVISLDAQGKINASNHAGRAIFEIPGNGEGLSLIEALRNPRLHEVAQRALRGTPGETEFEHGDGRSLVARAHPLKGGGAVLVILDLTELRRLERVRKDFVANVEHELRTPVAVIQTSSEVLVTHAGLSGKPLELVEAIHRHAERLGGLIASLLELSRLEAGKHETLLAPLRIAPVVEKSLLLCREQMNTAGVTVHNECPDHIEVIGDHQALERVLVNLLDNAMKYGGQTIWLRTVVTAGHVEVSIEDDGPGIEVRHQSRLFERFYRVDRGRSRDRGGSGLGLAIVKHLGQAMGGNVRFEERMPNGSRFVISLCPAEHDQPGADRNDQSS